MDPVKKEVEAPAKATPADPVFKDCLECRVTGCLTLSGVSLYALHLRLQTPIRNPGHRLFYAAFSAAFAGAAVYRGIM